MRLPERIFALGVIVLAGCSLLVDSNAVQCHSNQDCAVFDAAGPITCVNSVCVGPGGGPPCTTNMDCINRSGGAPAICRKDTMQCEPLLSPECAKVYGDPSNDDAIVLGTIFTLSGVNQPSGMARTQSAELAADDFKNAVTGLPGGNGGKPRPLVLVECDDAASNTQATSAANHLISVGVPAIIGPGGSGLVTAVAQSATIPAMVYLITPSATSITLSGLSEYVWRTAPSDALQAIAMQDQISALAALFTKNNPTYTKIKLAMAYEDNTYGSGLYGDDTNGLNLNGSAVGSAANMGYWFPLQYSSMTLDPSSAATSVITNAANVVVGIGTNELATKFVTPIEGPMWMTAVPRPLYLFSDAGQNPDLLTVVMSSTNGLRTRIRGTVPGTTNALFNTFSTEYQGKYGGIADVFGMAGAYDSVYIIAYCIVALGSGQVTGTAIANAMGKIVGGTLSNVGASNIQSAFQVLQSGNSIQINGASGPLHFDLNAHEAPSDISVWCISTGGTGNPVYASSGRYYDSTTATMTGTFACP